MIEAVFTHYSATKLTQLGSKITDCLQKLSEEQVWIRNSQNENAVGNLVLHLCGNVRQWICSGIGGQPDHRERDREFAARGEVSPAELSKRLTGTVSEAANIIQSIGPERLRERITVQKYTVTVLEGVYHVVEHFSQHTGQILFATKLLSGEDLGYYKHLLQPTHSEKTP